MKKTKREILEKIKEKRIKSGEYKKLGKLYYHKLSNKMFTEEELDKELLSKLFTTPVKYRFLNWKERIRGWFYVILYNLNAKIDKRIDKYAFDLRMKILYHPEKYFEVDKKAEKQNMDSYIASTSDYGKEEDTAKLKFHDFAKMFIHKFEGTAFSNNDMYNKTLNELKLDGHIKDYHNVRCFNHTINQRMLSTIVEFNNGTKVKFEPYVTDVFDIPYTFNAIYEQVGQEQDQIIGIEYDKDNDIIHFKNMEDKDVFN